MYRFAKAAVNVSGQAMRQVRHGSNLPQNFHSKYGAGVLVSGAIFCTAVWGYVLTSTGITWNLSPVGKIQPKPWREEWRGAMTELPSIQPFCLYRWIKYLRVQTANALVYSNMFLCPNKLSVILLTPSVWIKLLFGLISDRTVLNWGKVSCWRALKHLNNADFTTCRLFLLGFWTEV